jgi:hypothetical protein
MIMNISHLVLSCDDVSQVIIVAHAVLQKQ